MPYSELIKMRLCIKPEDIHIAHRLDRERRCGIVTQLNENTWLFAADVYDAQELMPWLRTFIGRVENLACSNKNGYCGFESRPRPGQPGGGKKWHLVTRKTKRRVQQPTWIRLARNDTQKLWHEVRLRVRPL